jgi:putative membrane protein
MKNIIIQLLATAVIVFLLANLLPGVTLSGFMGAVIFAIVLGLLNLILKPILKIISFPITFITLGLFLFVINAVIIKICDHFVDDVYIDGWLNVFIFSILLSIAQSIIGYFVKE